MQWELSCHSMSWKHLQVWGLPGVILVVYSSFSCMHAFALLDVSNCICLATLTACSVQSGPSILTRIQSLIFSEISHLSVLGCNLNDFLSCLGIVLGRHTMFVWYWEKVMLCLAWHLLCSTGWRLTHSSSYASDSQVPRCWVSRTAPGLEVTFSTITPLPSVVPLFCLPHFYVHRAELRIKAM